MIYYDVVYIHNNKKGLYSNAPKLYTCVTKRGSLSDAVVDENGHFDEH